MDTAPFLIDPSRLHRNECTLDQAVALIDLDAAGDLPQDFGLPPCPAIGIGNRGHPLAARLDAVVEPPVSTEAIVRQVLANPRAASTLVQLLRLLPALDPHDGLTAESLAYAVLQGSEEHRGWIAALKERGVPARTPGRVRLERDGDHLTIVLDAAENGNAIDRIMRDALYDALSLAALDREIAQVSLRASGRTFSLGAELGEFGTTTDPATAHAIRMQTLPARMALLCRDRLEAHVQGGCVGAGLELAAWARRLTATSGAWFQLPELAMGILPGAGGCVSLMNRIGRQRTALMMLSGKRLSARHAFAWGLIDAIVDDAAGD